MTSIVWHLIMHSVKCNGDSNRRRRRRLFHPHDMACQLKPNSVVAFQVFQHEFHMLAAVQSDFGIEENSAWRDVPYKSDVLLRLGATNRDPCWQANEDPCSVAMISEQVRLS